MSQLILGLWVSLILSTYAVLEANFAGVNALEQAEHTSAVKVTMDRRWHNAKTKGSILGTIQRRGEQFF